MASNKQKTVVMVAGEASGDLHGAHVIDALLRRDCNVAVSGAGGNAMRRAGANTVVDIKELSVMGITAVMVKLPRILRVMRRLKQHLATTRPDLVILIDFPDFNLHLAGYAKKLGLRVLYYISPTVWAWRSKRVFKIKKRVDHMAVILPFEKQIYEAHKIPVTYVGHPLLDDVAEPPDADRENRDMTRPTLALLPGSREDEVNRLLPNMLAAARILEGHHPQARFLISHAPSIDAALIDNICDCHDMAHIEVTTEPVGSLFARSDLAIVASGTASLEAAIYGVPTIIVYQVSAFSYWLGSKLVDVPHIGLANLIAGQRIFPELVQDDATAENMAREVRNLITDPEAYNQMLYDIDRIQNMLGEAGASGRVAKIACRLMEGNCAV